MQSTLANTTLARNMLQNCRQSAWCVCLVYKQLRLRLSVRKMLIVKRGASSKCDCMMRCVHIYCFLLSFSGDDNASRRKNDRKYRAWETWREEEKVQMLAHFRYASMHGGESWRGKHLRRCDGFSAVRLCRQIATSLTRHPLSVRLYLLISLYH